MRQEVEVRSAYDAAAQDYANRFGNELEAKAEDRTLLRDLAAHAEGGLIADLGCGPGHVTDYLARLSADVVGFDLSPAMIEVARRSYPELEFVVGSMLDLPWEDGSLSGAVAFYSVIHLTPSERVAAFTEIGRALRSGGHLLVAAHIEGPGFAAGSTNSAREFLGHPVKMDGYFIGGDNLAEEVQTAGFTVCKRIERGPLPTVEYPSRRCYLLAASE